jgi:hypothetical protein
MTELTTGDEMLEIDKVAAAAVKHAVLTHDAAVPQTSTLSWDLSRPYCHKVFQLLTSLLSGDADAQSALARLCSSPTDIAAHQDLADAVRRTAPRRPDVLRELARAAALAEREILFDYRVGHRYPAQAQVESLPELTDVARSRVPTGTSTRRDGVQIVIPFRDRHGDRIRNLVAAIAALRDQSVDPGFVTITVVETDATPRWRSIAERIADTYLFAVYEGPFNKSWAVNIGAVHGPTARLICALDVDILADRDFVQRCAGQFDDPAVAGLNVSELYFLDPPSTHAAIHQRCLRGASRTDPDELRGFVMRQPVGGCQWARADTYHAINGMDERYEGWGGEDRDLRDRLNDLGPVVRADLCLPHLDHLRQTMRQPDGALFNTDIPRDWSAGRRTYGDPDRHA